MPSPARPETVVDVRTVEAALIVRLKAGEELAFEELVRAHGPRMLAVARRFLPQEADAQDAVQDAFLNVSKSIQGFSGESRLSTWLHRVVVNCALMRIRTRTRRHEEPIEGATLEAAAVPRGPLSGLPGPAALLAGEETREKVRDCLARVPEAFRAVLLLRDVEGMELTEVGRLLDIGLSTVKGRLHRGRHALRLLLEAALEEPRT
jgi:RNA polymerase sigma-70 factor (ECF subfamily)